MVQGGDFMKVLYITVLQINFSWHMYMYTLQKP